MYVALGEQPHFLVEQPHHLCHGSFSGAGVADEDGVDVDLFFFFKALVLAQLEELDVFSVVEHLGFDAFQPDEGVQADHDLFKALVVVFIGG